MTNNAGLTEREFTRQRALWPFLTRLFSYSLHYRGWVAGLLLSALLDAACVASFPLLWLRYIDTFIGPTVLRLARSGTAGGFDASVWQQFGAFAGAYLVLVSAQAACVGLFNHFAFRIGEYVVFDLRREMFAKLQQLPYSFYDRSAIGWLLVRLTADVDKVSSVVSGGFGTLISGAFIILAFLVAMLSYSWQLTISVLLILPMLVVASTRIRLLMLEFSRRSRRLYSRMAAFLTEHINGSAVNKATVQEATATADFQQLTRQLRDSSFRSSRYGALYNPVIIVLGWMAAASVIYQGGWLLFDGTITVGVLAAFFAYSRAILEPILDITRYYAATQDSLSAGERIFALLDEPVTLADTPGAIPVRHLTGDIRFEGVSFEYLPDKPVITSLDLHIQAGESIALVGPTGEGKSTLMNLMCRFYEPTGGQIWVDGRNYRDFTIESYRQRLGIIGQTPYLFGGSIRNNVRYGKQDATDTELADCLRSIGADEFVGRLDEEVGEEGSRLSAGERQLLSFARAILKNPDILLMDEATSSLDTLAEAKIQRGIRQLTAGRTAVIIAHRLSTVRHCDRILVVHRGQIVEDGSHDQLLSRQGIYHGLYTRQFEETTDLAEKAEPAS